MELREKVLEILKDIRSDVDYENEDSLVDDHVLDSFGIIDIISEFESEFNISIPAREVIPSNFNSYEALCAMVERLKNGSFRS